MDLTELEQRPIVRLLEMSDVMSLENMARSRKQDIIFVLLKKYAKSGKGISGDDMLEILQDGFGLLCSTDPFYLAGLDDAYVSPSQIRRFNLRTGDTVIGKIRLPKEGERYFVLLRIDSINFGRSENAKNKIPLGNLTPSFPNERMKIEAGDGSTEDPTGRVIDLCVSIGKGRHDLIMAPSKAGKTIMLQDIASNIARNNPECHLIVLLIGGRPEKVTEIQCTMHSKMVAPTFDESPTHRVQAVGIMIEKAKRLVEHGKDVVILLDSTTRLTRAYDAMIPSSGKMLTGGADAHALEKPKCSFSAARSIEEGGSLTILAMALVETGSKMDGVIYEEFKDTGNMELLSDHRIAERRVFLTTNINRLGTRRKELLTSKDEFQRMWILHKTLRPMDEISVIEFLIDKLKQTKTNDELFDSMRRK